MTPPIKYSFELLDSFCCKNNVKLAHDYSKEQLFGSSKIIYHCSKCDNVNVKCFTYLIKRNTLCKHCVTIESLPKMKATMLEKYGVEHPSQSQEIKDKIVTGYITKYGVTNPSKLQEVKDKQKKTNLERYGVEYIVHNESSKEKMMETNLKKYGYSCCLQNKEIREAVKNTNLKKYGVENAGNHPDSQAKMKKSMLLKYGVEYPLQNQEVADKSFKSCFRKKIYISPSGKEIQCQGYEPFALDELVKTINEDDIITGCKNVPTIWYNDKNGKKHRHYVDIFITSKNKCIEVKSQWTIKKSKGIFEKQEAGKKLGYEYEIWVYDAKGNRVESYA